MEPEAQRIIAENLHRNFIDHAEYPISAEIEQRCVRMLADLFNAPGKTTGCRTQGSSEAIMLGALSLKWKWRERRQAANLSVDRPNLIFGGDVHVVWEKFCRYFDVEPRIVPLAEGKYTIGPEDVEPLLDGNTIGVVAVLGTTFTGHKDDVVGIDKLLRDVRKERDLDIPIHVDGASGASCGPSSTRTRNGTSGSSRSVRSTSRDTSTAWSTPASAGWSSARSPTCPRTSCSTRTTGQDRRDVHAELLTGAAMVLAQYYNFVRLGRQGYTYVMR
jgi:Glutamate decarboxylase and related PLP-dependent proteins